MIVAGNSTGSDSIAQLLTVLLIFLLVLALAYFTTRFVGTYQKTKLVNRNFEHIETYRITNGKYLQLVKAGSKYVVIGIGKDSISMICELSEDEIKKQGEAFGSSETFRAIMDKAREKFSKGDDKHEE